MNRLADIRDQEAICRARAQTDHARRAFWADRAEQWQQIARAEITFAFREGPSGHAKSAS
jgi:hypothetical protein